MEGKVLTSLFTQILTVSVLYMISADYAEWYTIVLIFLVASCTLMYAIISPVLYYLTMKKSPRDLRHWAITVSVSILECLIIAHPQETVSGTIFVLAWFVNFLICADVAYSVDNKTGSLFTWAAVSFCVFVKRSTCFCYNVGPFFYDHSSMDAHWLAIRKTIYSRLL